MLRLESCSCQGIEHGCKRVHLWVHPGTVQGTVQGCMLTQRPDSSQQCHAVQEGDVQPCSLQQRQQPSQGQIHRGDPQHCAGRQGEVAVAQQLGQGNRHGVATAGCNECLHPATTQKLLSCNAVWAGAGGSCSAASQGWLPAKVVLLGCRAVQTMQQAAPCGRDKCLHAAAGCPS